MERRGVALQLYPETKVRCLWVNNWPARTMVLARLAQFWWREDSMGFEANPAISSGQNFQHLYVLLVQSSLAPFFNGHFRGISEGYNIYIYILPHFQTHHPHHPKLLPCSVWISSVSHRFNDEPLGFPSACAVCLDPFNGQKVGQPWLGMGSLYHL